jgi:hypothetical protein
MLRIDGCPGDVHAPMLLTSILYCRYNAVTRCECESASLVPSNPLFSLSPTWAMVAQLYGVAYAAYVNLRR